MTIKLYNDTDVVRSISAPAQATVAATEIVISGSQVVLPAALKVGSKFRWRLLLTKTAAGTGNSVIKVKTNTTAVVAIGTTGGAATALTLTFPTAETAAIGSLDAEVTFVVTAVDPTNGTAYGHLSGTSTAGAAVGLSNQSVAALSGSIATDGSIQSVGLSLTSGAADVITVNYSEVEFSLP